MALVACTGVIAASTQASVKAIVETEMRAPLIVDSATWVVPQDAVAAVRDAAGPGGLDVVRLGTTSARLASDDGGASDARSDASAVDIAGVPARFFETALDPVTLDGDATAALEAGDAVVHRRTAREQGWTVGDVLRIGLAGEPREVRVGAVIDSQIVSDGLVVARPVFDDVVPASQQTVRAAYARPAAGTTVDELRAELRTAVEPFLVVTVRDRAETASAVSDQVDQVLAILYALLALSIVIALLGIVNTLALSVIERTREIGLLRAVGLGRLQLAGVIAIESVLIAVYGTVLGVAVGVAVGAALPGVLADEGLSTLAIPWTQVLLVLAAAVVIGLLASIGPAVRAARLPVLEAVTVD
jgi:putative ABC transport system permease protein